MCKSVTMTEIDVTDVFTSLFLCLANDADEMQLHHLFVWYDLLVDTLTHHVKEQQGLNTLQVLVRLHFGIYGKTKSPLLSQALHCLKYGSL